MRLSHHLILSSPLHTCFSMVMYIVWNVYSQDVTSFMSMSLHGCALMQLCGVCREVSGHVQSKLNLPYLRFFGVVF